MTAQKKTELEGRRIGAELSYITESDYDIEAEIGTFTTKSHRLISGRETIINSAETFFLWTQPREKWYSCRFNELLYMTASHMSDRDSSILLNRIRCQEQGIIATTLRNHLERDGAEIAATLQSISNTSIEDFKVNIAANEDDNNTSTETTPSCVCALDKVESAAQKLNINEFNADDFELPGSTANISIDDVSVKAQKPNRPMPEGSKMKKRVDNTVIHFEDSAGKYILNGDGLVATIRLLIGFLVYNSILLKKQLVFFTDGARSIHNEIEKTFRFTKFKIILDWYHLQKKTGEVFSLAFKGRVTRNDYLGAVMKLLWRGNVSGAIELIENADPDKIKAPDCLTQYIDYLNRVRGYIPCYELRSELGLRNSSNLGEKSNDIVVAERQKHNGMSWSKPGSVSLAHICCACANGEIHSWAHHKVIPFRQVEKENQIAA